jgi:DUF1680 family protein
MKRAYPVFAVAMSVLSLAAPSEFLLAQEKPGYVTTPVSHRDVTITDEFWSQRIENNRKVTIPDLLRRSGNRGPNLRVLEAACYSLVHHPDPELQAIVDGSLDPAIASIRRNKGVWPQRGDGSLPGPGYFFEAAVAHHELTGSRKLLDVAIEIADDLDSLFGPGKRHDISNHEGVKNGLVRLYLATGEERYLKLAQFFLDRRGNPENREVMYGPYAQDHRPIVDQERAIGHAVRATYLYMSLTDIAALTGKRDYRHAIERIWQDAVAKRTYLTGGVGAYRDEEDYSDDFDLPNLSTWNEICAAFGSTMWNHRMFLASKDAAYIDMLERTLYNGFLVGISLDAQKYLYQAPLRSYGDFDRHTSFGPNCCPPNIARLFPQLGGLIYATDDDELFVNLYIANQATAKLQGGPVRLQLDTRYPWDGKLKLTVSPKSPQKFVVRLRIPGWARGEAAPGGLYRYEPSPRDTIQPFVHVNGAPLDYSTENGYVKIDREWKPGDSVEVEFDMPVRRVLARDEVADNAGMVALERGPLIYCLEKADNPGGVFHLYLPDNASTIPGIANLGFHYDNRLLGGIGTLHGEAKAVYRTLETRQRQIGDAEPVTFTVGGKSYSDAEVVAIPYYAIANRGPGEMTVWIPRDESKAWIEPTPSIAATSRASSSVGDGTVAENYPGGDPPTVARRFYPRSQDGSGSIKAVQDQLEPVNSEDGSAPFLRIRPQSGDQAWLQYDFAKPEQVSSVAVYWKDDKQYCIPPKSWRLLYRDGGEWKPVATSGHFGTAVDQFNRVTFEPVTTGALRMEITLQPHVFPAGKLGPPDGNYLSEDLTWHECGVIEWIVDR